MKHWFPTRPKKTLDKMREIRCQHCKNSLTITNIEDIIVFCDEACLESYLCEVCKPSREETLNAIEFEEQRYFE